ncbi:MULTISPECIES: 3-hydroxyacyl-CoA dehydrogenase family protein [Halorussus]|uniref:3-hydroxyacyl-CoA dehydrogenase family protein n=1 Tax=Halorussus TaxID=1070314 RepID=UPI000E2108B8|nr:MULTISPECIES: 3-hydroxyacyl-CoA dehydrogenase family protein [Halorussus]NHN60073.1 3-hydroxyacyl-CoA dehydrogenase family protein [Halorussus sp. JP-T4]
MSDLCEVSIVGAGAMGHGLAVQCAVCDRDVTLVDHRRANLDRARGQVRDAVAFLHDEGLTDRVPDSVLDRIEFTLDRDEGVESADVVLETISEDLAAKRDLFADLAEAAPADAVLASNTSSIPITDIAEGAPDHADRIAGCHWWYPPYLLTPVEVVRGEATADGTVERLRSFVEAVDRDPILVERDAPGFVWNRVQFAVVRECLHIVEQGIASVDDVNRAIRDGYATRTAAIGPFETMDIAGLDLFETIAEDLYPDLATDESPQAELRDRVDEGRTGIDAGAGFYEYDDAPGEVTRRRDETVAAIRRALEERAD